MRRANRALGGLAILGLVTACGGPGPDASTPWAGRWRLVAVNGEEVSALGVRHTYAPGSFEGTWLIGGHGACVLAGELATEGARYRITRLRLTGNSSGMCRADVSDDVGTFAVSHNGHVLALTSDSRGTVLRLTQPAGGLSRFAHENARKLRRLAWGLLAIGVGLGAVRLAEPALRRGGVLS
jgi:hypothetical protein